MSFLDCLFVKRDWAQDRANIHRLFDRYKAHRIPVCVVSFLEGTRITPAKLAAAREYAKERGLYLPSHTLVPRTKGFVATIAGLRDHLDAVYDLTIRYGDAGDDRVPSLVNCFEAKVRRVHLHVKRYPIDALPADPALHDWVMARFREKDDLLADLQRDGRFPGPERNTRVRVMDWFRPEARRIGSEDS
jgi:1-acyl-sn-glycerol-3-phosphate acyltransferase